MAKQNYFVGDDGELVYLEDETNPSENPKRKRGDEYGFHDDEYAPQQSRLYGSRRWLRRGILALFVFAPVCLVFTLAALEGVPLITARPTHPPFLTLHSGAVTSPFPLAAPLVAGMGTPTTPSFFIPPTIRTLADYEASPRCADSPITDGGLEVVTQQLGDDTELFIQSATSICRLTDNDFEDRDPVWSHDGERIAFVSDRDGQPDIYVADPEGTDVVRLTADDADHQQLVWSSDDAQLYFIDFGDLYVMNADGSDRRIATNDEIQWYRLNFPDATPLIRPTMPPTADGQAAPAEGW